MRQKEVIAMENIENKKTNIKKERSVKYPYYGLSACLDFAALIDQLAGRAEASENAVLSALNINSPKNNSYTYKISSAVQFGLVEKKGTGIKITDTGRLILYPPEGEEQKKELIRQAFLAPPLYQKLYERYNRKHLPPTLPNVLLDMGIARNKIDRTAKEFISSAHFAEILDDNNTLSLLNSNSEEKDSEKESLKKQDNPIEHKVFENKTDENSYVVSVKGPGVDLNIEIKEKNDIEQVELLKTILERKMTS